MQFANPQALLLLLLWFALAWMAWHAGRWRRAIALEIGQLELLERLYPAGVRRWRRRRSVLMLGAALFMIIAAARPQYGRIERTVRSSAANVIIAIDCSRSMQAKDVLPDRMTRARGALGTLLRRLAGDRVGIVAFAGAAFLQCPMTLDHEMAAIVLDSIDTNSVGVPGTDLGEAVQISTRAFENGAGEGGRALVLLTDGEDNEGHGLEEAKKAAAKGVKVYAIGFGTARGAPLTNGAQGGFEKDATGNIVNSQLDMGGLQRIAQATGGAAFDAGDAPEHAIDQVLDEIQNLQKADLESRRLVLHQDRFQWFLFPALFLLIWLMLSRPERTRLARSGVTT